MMATAQAACIDHSTLTPIIWMPAMNTFRRFAGPPEPMFAFYSDVLGFEALTPRDVGNNTQVFRIRAGSSELKFSRREEGRTYVRGGVAAATGLRLWTFFFRDEAELKGRFHTAGLSLPIFMDVYFDNGKSKRSAVVADPDGQDVELVVTDTPPASGYNGVEIGMTVSNFAESIAFYRDFVGLDCLGSEFDAVFNTTKHSFRHGSTIVTLRSYGAGLPADSGSAGIQYVVSDVHRVDELARCRSVRVDKPLGGIPGFNITTIWLDDPDGITNYFAETDESRGG